jgi:glycosyltransferase involved in cell wall biosynthesis
VPLCVSPSEQIDSGTLTLEAIGPYAVDVVIPVRDGARYIARCLDSVKAQTRPVRAAIVVDDGSTDATPAILEQYRRRWPLLEVVRTEKCGVSHARNVGVAKCQAPFVAFLDSDDVWVATKLERQMALFAGDPSRLGFVYCGFFYIDVDGRPIEGRTTIPRLRGNVLRDLLVEGNVIWGSSSAVVARRELLERVGGFDERLWYGEDWDVWLKLAEQAEVEFAPDPLVGIQLHDKGAPSALAKKRQLLQDLMVVDRWHTATWFPASVRAQYRDRLAGIAYGKVAEQSIMGWLFAWRLMAELKRSENRFARDLFAGPVDFLRELSPRIAKAIRRRTGARGGQPI